VQPLGEPLAKFIFLSVAEELFQLLSLLVYIIIIIVIIIIAVVVVAVAVLVCLFLL